MTQLFLYQPSSDLLFVQLYAQLEQSGDLQLLFPPDGCSLSEFFATLGAPRDTTYAFDSKGIWLLTWFEPMRHGALFNGWIREDYRRTELQRTKIREVLMRATAMYKTVVGITAHASVVRFCEKVGFTYGGTIPGLIADQEATIIYCTQAMVAASRAADVEALQIHQ